MATFDMIRQRMAMFGKGNDSHFDSQIYPSFTPKNEGTSLKPVPVMQLKLDILKGGKRI
ncbi:hypothetical protein [Nostoc linckia]|uniref:hypothetical protein n=1 Tax=Nostoc linckia TaxID=92942 RepID=UPI0015D4EF39|nr:hypothetical protein [Nostoc linckia]